MAEATPRAYALPEPNVSSGTKAKVTVISTVSPGLPGHREALWAETLALGY